MNTWLIYSVLVVSVRGASYCSLCQGHTMCLYEAGGGSTCQDRGYRRGLSDQERTLILNLHNSYRQKVATGNETRRSQPSAADMREMTWDSEVESVAQRWADQCAAQGHDGCRTALDGTPVGQNIASGWSTGIRVNRSARISGSIQSWYDEVKDFSPDIIRSYRFDRGGETTGHYTQMVWATSSRLGCGFLDRTEDNGRYSYKLVCNYKPAGNYIGRPVYTVGKPCSRCATCSQTWNGLCA